MIFVGFGINDPSKIRHSCVKMQEKKYKCLFLMSNILGSASKLDGVDPPPTSSTNLFEEEEKIKN